MSGRQREKVFATICVNQGLIIMPLSNKAGLPPSLALNTTSHNTYQTHTHARASAAHIHAHAARTSSIQRANQE